MKTAEEWYKENNKSGECFALITRSDIKQVQADAYKEGMRAMISHIDKEISRVEGICFDTTE